MFKDRTSDAVESVAGGELPAAQLTHAQILQEPGPRRISRISNFSERYGEWRQQLSLRLSGRDLAPDLAQDIGSARWLRGVATLIGLSGLALAAWPDFSPLTAARAMQMARAELDEFRSQTIMPLALGFFLSMQQSAEEGKVAIELLPRVSEYLGLIMTLIFAFGLCFQLPVALSLLGRAGLVTSKQLKSGRKYAIVGIFVFAAILTPPDIISQVGLGVPTLLLYEISILSVSMIERRRREAREEDEEERGPYEDEKTDL